MLRESQTFVFNAFILLYIKIGHKALNKLHLNCHKTQHRYNNSPKTTIDHSFVTPLLTTPS